MEIKNDNDIRLWFRIKSIDKKIKKLRDRKKVLLDKFLDGVFGNEIYITKEDELSGEIKKLY